MKSLRSRLDIGLLLTLAFCSFTLWPLLKPGLPNGTDVLYHVYRAAEMDRAWSHGVLFPRWAEGLYYGYGSPLFHYYASLTYYLTSLLTRILGFETLDSLRALIVLCMLGGGAGMYLFIKQRTGKLAGVIAAVVYIYSPYLLYTEPYARGDYPELLAFALFPLLMWRFERLLITGRGRNLALAAVCVMLLILAHNLMALVLFGLLVAWLLWEWVWGTWLSRSEIGKTFSLRRHILALSAAAIGVGLASYFWLPVLLEQGEVKLENLTAIALLDYRNFFLQPGQLLAASPRSDAGAINGLLHHLNLGLPQWGLALTGIIGLVIVRARHTVSFRTPLHDPIIRQMLFFSLAAFSLIILMLLPSIWEVLRPLSLLQFPWRFLGPAAFCLAALAGMNAVWIERLPVRWGNLVVVIVVILPIAFALPMLYVPEWVHESIDTSIAAYQQSEVADLQRGTTFTNEYLPKSVEVLADSTSWLLADFADGYPVDKAHRAFLPEDVTITLLEHGPQHDTWQVETDVPFTMEVLTHYFAGWQAEIDGQRVDITPSNPHGFINFSVPAGEHTVRLFLGSTPARDLGYAVSALTLVGLAGVVRWVYRTKQSDVGEGLRLSRTLPLLYLPLTIGVTINLALVLMFMREGLAWVKSPAGEALVAEHQVKYSLKSQGVQGSVETEIQFLGYDLSGETFHPGDRLELVVYWYAPAPIPYNYQSFVHVSSGGPPAAQADKQNPAGRPTTQWTSDGYIRDEYVINLPENMPPGAYNLLVGLYTCETLPAGECGNGDRLQVFDSDGELLGDAVLLGIIIIR
jgi:hypothetical protein